MSDIFSAKLLDASKAKIRKVACIVIASRLLLIVSTLLLRDS